MLSPSQQVEQQIEEDLDKFKNEIYKEAINVPENILELFKKSVMALAPQYHKVLANRIKVIASKKAVDLTVDDLSAVVTIIVNTPLNKIYSDFYEAINSTIKIEKFILSYNEYVSKFQEELKAKKLTLLSLSGAKNNGLRIIN